ncbi:MAG: ribosome-associated translation inhibitor RaiA [Candidatus Paceibacterota bacterium]
MKYNVKATDFPLTPAISEYLNKKVNHLDKFINSTLEETVMCYIEVGKTTGHHKTGDLFKAEFTLHLGGKVFRASEEKEDLYSAIDVVTEEMAEELRSFKNKKKGLVRRGASKIKSIVKSIYGANK